MKLQDLALREGIEDKGIFKGAFLAGMPGSGKSTIAGRITDGTVSPKFVNVDKAFEFLSNKQGEFPTSAAWALFGQLSKSITQAQLAGYLNGMLPLYVDGTGGNAGAMVRRRGILEGLGYDTMMIWVDVSLETAIERVNHRPERQVDVQHVESVYAASQKNKQYYKSTFGANFLEVTNEGNDFNESEAYSTANRFFASPIQNPTGVRSVELLRAEGAKVLTPTLYPVTHMRKLVDVWFTR